MNAIFKILYTPFLSIMLFCVIGVACAQEENIHVNAEEKNWEQVQNEIEGIDLSQLSPEELKKLEEEFLHEIAKDSGNGVLLATINIYETEILNQKNNVFDLSFLITNREKAQPSIKYAIQLVSKNHDGGKTVIDERVYSEVLSLGENSEIRKEITYEAPEYLNGTYFLDVVSRTEGGLMLGVNSFGEVSLNGDNEYVEVLRSDCFLSIEGEAADKKYNLSQGVDVRSDEILKLNCEVQNHSDKDAVLSYFSNNFYRTVFGDKGDIDETYKKVTELKSNEEKNISIEIAKEDKPQAYDAVVHFRTDKNIAVNNIKLHYVLRGKSASIVNLLLDKNFYNEGEQAEISFFYTGPADSFPGSRLGRTSLEKIIAKFKIKNENNELCGPEVSSELNRESVDKKFTYSIDQFCPSPAVEAVLLDGVSGEVLARESFDFTSPEEFTKKATTVQADDGNTNLLLVVSLVVIALLIGVFFLVRSRGTSITTILAIIFVSSFLFSSDVSADTYSFDYSVKGGGPTSNYWPHNFTLNYSLNKSTYSPGETITANLWMSSIVCQNSVDAGRLSISFPFDSGGSMYLDDNYDSTEGGSSLSLSGGAPTSPGSYDAAFAYSDMRYFWAKVSPTVGDFWPDVYFWNKAVQLNSIMHDGRTNWTGPEAEDAIVAAGMTAWSHYQTYGISEGVDGYLYAYDHGIYTSDFEGDEPEVIRTIPFTVVEPSYSCTGSTPSDAIICSGDTSGLSSDTSWREVSSCTAGRKCEYTVPTYSCTGSTPSDAVTCSGDTSGLTSNTSWQEVSSCTSGRKCEYTVPSYSCTGSTPSDAVTCSGDTSGLTSNTSWQEVSSCTSARKCEYTVPTYSCTGSTPSYAVTCSGDTSGLTSNTSWQEVSSCTSARKCEYRRPAPSLTLTASPDEIIEGDSTTISWTSVDADNCTASGDWSGSKSASSDSDVMTLNTAGTYTYSMQCSNSSLGSSPLRSVTVDVYEPLSANIQVSDDRNVGDTVVWLADVSGGIPHGGNDYKISWSGDFTKTGWYDTLADRRIKKKYSTTGSVTVDLKAEDSKGNFDTDSRTIIIEDTRLPQ